jgi:hypothetical protein
VNSTIHTVRFQQVLKIRRPAVGHSLLLAISSAMMAQPSSGRAYAKKIPEASVPSLSSPKVAP